MKVLILANGDAPTATCLRLLAAESAMIVAVDGGVNAAIVQGVTPHIICGDFDSADMSLAQSSFPAAEFVLLADQNHTDLEKSVQLAIERGATSIAIAGAMGGRMDHSFASLSVLLRYHDEIPIRLADEASQTWVLSSGTDTSRSFSYSTRPGDTISLLALAENVRVSISAVQWPLHNQILPIGTLGVSNVATGEQVTIDVCGGPLIFCHLQQG